jgi:hypothetical protein
MASHKKAPSILQQVYLARLAVWLTPIQIVFEDLLATFHQATSSNGARSRDAQQRLSVSAVVFEFPCWY